MSDFGDKFSSYSLTQLNNLLEDDDKLDKIVQDMEEVQKVQQTKQMTLASNRSLAEQNLLLQPRLDSQKNELTKRYQHLQDLFEAFQLRKSTLDYHSGINSLDTLLALLQTEGAKIEEETENMADSFLEGNVSLDTFVDEYHSRRKLAHLRRVKIDKLREVVLKGHRLTQAQLAALATHPQDPAASASFLPNSGSSPVPQLRKAPTLQPTQLGASQPASDAYSGTPYPSIPPRVSYPQLGSTPSFPSPSVPFVPQYPPALPQGPPPRPALQPGFILQ
ncbi:vacuolar protein sorting-associated protein 37B-like [Scleropages formosus]|uniref:Vacuolar protein sorting-associated protein 37B-like n=1 Tax=Scleropages formosus TaxID=113540 RepID=A0A0P7Z1L1_SCLFO|nr:vacuolar protein sorting-associated protein 37B-like [Scleropages formosus]